MPVEGVRTPLALVRTRFDDRMPSVSPDGRWLAFASDESGQFEVYVQPFPGPGERVRVSTMGGAQPEWRHDGRELSFVGLDDRLMAVPVQSSAVSSSLEPGQATPLFRVRIPNGAIQTGEFWKSVRRLTRWSAISRRLARGRRQPDANHSY